MDRRGIVASDLGTPEIDTVTVSQVIVDDGVGSRANDGDDGRVVLDVRLVGWTKGTACRRRRKWPRRTRGGGDVAERRKIH